MAAMGGGAAMLLQEQMPGQVDHAKRHAAERDSLELIGATQKTEGITWVGDKIEERVLQLYA